MSGTSWTARAAAALATAAVLLASGAAGAAPAATPPPALPPPLASRGTVAYDAAGTARLYTLVNAHRTAVGRAPLRVHEGLAAIARGWTAHMATTQVLAHNDALFTRAQHTALRIATFGENVAYSSVSLEGANTVLLESPHHRENIENGTFAVGGFAVFTDTRGWYWVTEDFGTEPKALVARPAPAPAPRPAPVTVAPRAVARPVAKAGAKAAPKPVARPVAGPVAAAYVRPVVAVVSRAGVARVDASAAPAARADVVRAAAAGDVPHGVSWLAWLAAGLIALVTAGLSRARRAGGRSARLAG